MRTAPSSTRQHFHVRSGAAVNVPFLRRVIHQTLSCRIFSSSLDNSTYGSYAPFSAVRARRCSRAAENNQPGALTRQLMKPWRHRATGSGRRAAVIAINGDSSDKQLWTTGHRWRIIADGPLATFGRRVRDRDARTPARQTATATTQQPTWTLGVLRFGGA